MSLSRNVCHALVPQRVRRSLADWLVARSQYLVRPMLTTLSFRSPLVKRAVVSLCEDVVYEIENAHESQMRADRLAHILNLPEEVVTIAPGYFHEGLDGHIPLPQRISGQILPFLEPVLAEPGIQRVLEIGCANGAIIAQLAAAFPRLSFLGLDLKVPAHVRARETANLAFKKGYALTLLEQNQLPAPLDVVYFQFTATNFLPKEMARYFQLFQRHGVRWVVLNEPTRTGFPITLQERRSRSVYLGCKMWKHDYPGLARRAGYDVTVFQAKHWSGLIEPRFNRVRYDTHLVQMVAKLRDSG